MARLTTGSAITAAVVAFILSACQTVAPASPMPSTAAVASASLGVRPTSSSTAQPTMPEPTASALACPSDLPTNLASIDELAARTCYGTTELTIDGWLAEEAIGTEHGEATPDWVMPISAVFAHRPTAGEWTFDTLMAGGFGGLEVVTAPTSGIDLAGRGRPVTLRGHFNDPDVLACVPALVDTYPDEWAGPDCDRLFMVTSLKGQPLSSPACPRESPITLATFMAADAFCFVGHDVRITGWEDVGTGFGGATSAYQVKLAPGMKFADAQLVSHRWESDLAHDTIFPVTISGSGVTFDRPDVRVVVTARLGHPASDGCRPRTLTDWTWVPPISWAQHRCEHLLVITDVDVRS